MNMPSLESGGQLMRSSVRSVEPSKAESGSSRYILKTGGYLVLS
jgi:hypothetical protein